jgi:GNAT superfamily N-acetyltransferase
MLPLGPPTEARLKRSPAAAGVSMRCREMRMGEEQAVLDLVMRGFEQFVAPGFSPEGIAEFSTAARRFVLERPDGHVIHVAESRGAVIGMIDLADASHICLFFVETAHQRKGVGRNLLAQAIAAQTASTAITVNSAPSAVPAYRALGFIETAPEADEHGIRFVAMRKDAS